MDVHRELILQDANINPAFQPELVVASPSFKSKKEAPSFDAAIRRSIWEGQPYDEALTGLERRGSPPADLRLACYRAGRELYAIGSNPDGARLAGVRSDRRVLAAFVLAGALAVFVCLWLFFTRTLIGERARCVSRWP